MNYYVSNQWICKLVTVWVFNRFEGIGVRTYVSVILDILLFLLFRHSSLTGSTSLHVCTDIKNKAYVVLYWQSFDLKFCSIIYVTFFHKSKVTVIHDSIINEHWTHLIKTLHKYRVLCLIWNFPHYYRSVQEHTHLDECWLQRVTQGSVLHSDTSSTSFIVGDIDNIDKVS